ncbi:MAG: hypothetical protein TREMPRED_004543 [Tremellales sp. Tagirdzhanova-0007]|nr:MAG: hypothetical protein TREMPRED_004543 [Tremellales sp. Tagirdzhanova-0007]
MNTRRTSARLSGGSIDGAEMAGMGIRNEVRVIKSWKRSTLEEDEMNGKGEMERKKRKKEVKKQPAFRPQPVPILNSSDTPPDDVPVNLPPPPSERKIARRRESTRAARERVQDDSPPPLAKRQKTSSTTNKSAPSRPQRTERDDLLADIPTERASSKAPPHVDFLNFSVSQRPKPSGPRPASPPRQPFSSNPISGRPSMGPPTGPFIRKTRKSMVGMQDLTSEAVVPIPDSETPMIRKNKELREAQRRSSLGMRGQRASSSLGRGEITIAPSSSGRPKGKDKIQDAARTEEGDRLVKEIMEEFMVNLGKGAIDTNVFASGGAAESFGMPLRPHPRNVSNLEVQSTTEAVVKRCKQEDAQWSSLIKRANAKQGEGIERLRSKKATNAEPDLSRAEPWLREALGVADQAIGEGEGDLSAMGEFADVEYKVFLDQVIFEKPADHKGIQVDTLLQTSHAALQYSLQAQRFLDGIFSALTTDLRSRERLFTPPIVEGSSDAPDPVALLSSVQAGTSSSINASAKSRDPILLLRALASAEAKQQSEDTVAAAAMVAPVAAMTPRRPAPGTTPRRAGTLGPGTTPRRGGYGKSLTPAVTTSAE